jgi:hypothetical protein
VTNLYARTVFFVADAERSLRFYTEDLGDQGEPLRKHIVDKGIQTQRVEWGRPTLVIRDLVANELFFWLPHDDFGKLT